MYIFKSRYSFNGKESNDEISGDGNSMDFGARMYDSRIGRWFSKDPFEYKYTGFSPYSFALNSPIRFMDYGGKYIIDQNNNIIFQPSNKTPVEYFFRTETKQVKVNDQFGTGQCSVTIETGYTYAVRHGFIFDDKGNKVAVMLVTKDEVYSSVVTTTSCPSDADGSGRPTVSSNTGSEPLEDTNPYTNCTGLAFTDGKFVLLSDEVSKDFLKAEGYNVGVPDPTSSNSDPKAGDVGLYYRDGIVVHAEVYTDKNKVTSKGGITKQIYDKSPGSTWPKRADPLDKKDLGYDTYRIAYKDSKHVATKYTLANSTSKNGISEISRSDARKMIKDIKKSISNN